MIVSNQNQKFNFGENHSPEISLNSNLKRWFSRNIGMWKSNRTYFLDEVQKTYNLCMNLKIEALKNNPNGSRTINLLGIQKKNIIFLRKIRNIKREEKCVHS